jgi:hypothetical protein
VERPLELEDIQFLIKNAARLFPANPASITGPGVRNAVWGLQSDLVAEREVCLFLGRFSFYFSLLSFAFPAFALAPPHP